MVDVPTVEQLAANQSISVFAAPPGVKCAPVVVEGREHLMREGWLEVSVGMAPEYPLTMQQYGVRAKRKAYGLRPFVASTIHGVQGATLPELATRIEFSDKEFRLWEKAQLVVLISRTRFLSSIFFVGSKASTLQMVRKVMAIRCQFAEYTEHVLRTAAGQFSVAPTIDMSVHPFRPRDTILPDDESGFCYMLVSCRTWVHTYIGQCIRIEHRIEQHNSGQGAAETRTNGPWKLVAFVQGFDGCRTSMRHFEDDWQTLGRSRNARELARNGFSRQTLIESVEAAEDLIKGVHPNFRQRAYVGKELRLETFVDLA